jgi:multidrug efflux system membrane fusion protein
MLKRGVFSSIGRKWGLQALVILLLFPLYACPAKETASTAPKTPPPAPVRIAEVNEREMPAQFTNVGSVEAFSTIMVKPQVSGELTEVSFTEGDVVEEGQKLFTIDPRPYEVAKEQAEANLAKSDAALELSKANVAKNKAQAENARAEFARDATLLKKGMCSQSEYDLAKANAEALDSSVDAEEANIRSANESIRASKAAIASAVLQLDYCTIKSPIKGKTGSLQLHRGNIVKTTDSTYLVNITQTEPIYVTFTVPEKHLWEIREEMSKGPLSITVVAPEHEDVPIKGQLAFIDNEVDQPTGSIRMKGKFSNEDGRLWPGMFVKVTLQIALRDNVVVVPAQAVQVGQNGPYAYVVTAEMKAELRNLKIGDTIDGLTVIHEGVNPGEKVITDGHLRVTPGGMVKLADANGGATKANDGAAKADDDAAKANDGAAKTK